jgi:hypothetical protein
VITVTVNIPREKFAALSAKLKDMTGADGPLDAVGKFVASDGMFRVFSSHGEGTWAAVLRGGDPLDDTGVLKGGFVYAMGSDGRSVVVTNEGREKMIQHVQNEGKTIHAVNLPYLHFKVGDRWVKKVQVVIPARRFFVWLAELRQSAVEVAKAKLLEETVGAFQ